MSIAEFSRVSPASFWPIIYLAWGAVYGAITVALVVMYLASKLYLRDNPRGRIWLGFLHAVWAVGQLAGVFGFPLLIGAYGGSTLVQGTYAVWWIGSWFATVFIAWLICRRLFRFSDLS